MKRWHKSIAALSFVLTLGLAACGAATTTSPGGIGTTTSPGGIGTTTSPGGAMGTTTSPGYTGTTTSPGGAMGTTTTEMTGTITLPQTATP